MPAVPDKKSKRSQCQQLDSLVDLTDTISMNDVLSEVRAIYL